ncbi:IS5 family transposase [Streptomyces sp. NPDC091281]|uniref:IS5 family transposase n=1 Tax=Streptomyces sp. NPDC091281 TaxID=3365985 RepID=UPI0038016324
MGKAKGPPWLVADDLWVRIEPLLPVRSRRVRNPGRLPLNDRECLQGILFVPHTGIQWEWLPQELGFGSGMTCWCRLRDWNEAGVWDRLHEVLLTGLHQAGKLDWSRAVIDGSHHQARRGGPETGPSPVGRDGPGSEHHVITDGHGIPPAITLTGGNRNDVTRLLPLLEAIPHIKGRTGRPRHRPRQLFADRGHDFDKYRRLLWQRGIKPVTARRGTPHGSGLGAVRWAAERTNPWIHGFRRLRIRWEIRDDIHEALLKLACSLITYPRVKAFC